jgi:MOSC domain-containing protein YiiM
MQNFGFDIDPGDFAENMTVEGLDPFSIPPGTRLWVGKEAILEITQIGKECHT